VTTLYSPSNWHVLSMKLVCVSGFLNVSLYQTNFARLSNCYLIVILLMFHSCSYMTLADVGRLKSIQRANM